ncbi:MAG: type II secretion system F family protein [Pigmentiphaga sp.]|uniref:type II secretion system F family protein n=1 Tax=Pigmentiphaga sp. TaxID=1977564 RepID=UPI0029BCE2E4|nr:type II secretion system F family protein [Pigmentiphaga sp.]MDX3907672.1 type II secretion system F family protein [Pigmentiphaga sp.]
MGMTALLAGTAVAALAVLVYFLVADSAPVHGQTVEAPPPAFRLAWRLIVVAAYYCRPWLSWQRRRRVESMLVQAGLRHCLGPLHVVGAQVLCAGAAAVASAMAAVAAAGMAAGGGGVVVGAVAGACYPRLWLADRIRRRRAEVRRALPFALDMTTLCVEAGLHVGAALQQAAQKGPPGPLREELRRVLGDVRTGVPRARALRDMAERLDVPEVRAWVGTLAQADALGMNLAPILRAQSDQRRTERFLRAERLAMEAPVKMLLPLIACIFPCSFVVIGFPIAIKLMDPGW